VRIAISKEIIRAFYDSEVQYEWERLERHPIEWILTTHELEKTIKPGESVLDLGGGPGRYTLHFARMGCQVTLVDLSDGCVGWAKARAEEEGLAINTIQGDALDADMLLSGQSFDHVLMMGPLYHLLLEEDRKKAVENALVLTKPGGRLYLSFLLMFSGVIYYMSNCPEMILGEAETPFLNAVMGGYSYGGPAFTEAFFVDQNEILPFMNPFGLEDQHLFGQEGILGQFENQWLLQPDNVKKAFLDLAIPLLERPEYLSYAEHAMLHGRKPQQKDNPR
jgi:SAM-dependent methyltransferase